MQGFMIMLLICSVTMSALAVFYMLITPVLAKRYSEKGRYYAWLIVVIGLIIPFRPQFSNPIVKVDMPSDTTMPIIQIGNGTPINVLNGNIGASPISPSISWWHIAAAIWLVGMIAFVAYHAIKHYHFVKMVKRWSESVADEQALTLFQSIKAEMGISKEINLCHCLSIGSPMMIGFANPRILFPKMDFAHDELCFIFKHELVHYKRKDLYYKCLVLLATAIHWFNPLVYLMARAIDVQCELSCDAEIVRSTDSNTRQHYSETIIGVVKYQSKLKTALSTNFYGGKKGMKKRIFSIMDTGRKKAGVAVISAVLLMTTATGFAFAANVAQMPDEQIGQSTIMSHNDEETGKPVYSVDDGKTWMTEAEYEATYPINDIVWWTYDDYKAWLDNEKAALPALIGQPYSYYDKDNVLHKEVWTQGIVNKTISQYEQILQSIKNGAKVSKTFNGDDSVGLIMNPSSSDTSPAFSAAISLSNGAELSFGPYDTKEKLLAAIEFYCKEQVKKGNMTQSEYDEIINRYSN
jgi:beta-lactamase regulating signal transducer with metallopeptidase domain